MRGRLPVAAALLLAVAGCGGESALMPTSPPATVTSTTTVAATTPATTSTQPPTTTAPTTTTLPDAPATPGALALTAPEGWFIGDTGMVVAEDAADLEGATPSGPRVLEVTSPEMDGMVPDHVPAATELTGVPTGLTVAGFPAFAVTLTEQLASGPALASTTVVVDTGEGTAQVFLLQAPADGYAAVEATLLAAIGLR